MNVSVRRILLSGALVIAVLLAWSGHEPGAESPRTVSRSMPQVREVGGQNPSVQSTSGWQVVRLMPRSAAQEREHPWPLFRTNPPIPPARQVERPPSSSAPELPEGRPQVPLSLPYVLLGRMDEESGSVVFLQDGERTLVLKAGSQIGEEFRVERFDGPRMVLRHLPTGRRIALEVGGAG